MSQKKNWFKLIPKPRTFSEYTKENSFNSFISVIEDLDLPRFDVLVDTLGKTTKFFYRYDGKAVGEGLEKWRKFFDTTFDLQYILTYIDFTPAILRFVASDLPSFLKLESLYYVDEKASLVRTISPRMIEEFATKISIDYLPLVYHGEPIFERISSLVKIPVMGVPRNGVFVIQETLPIEYVRIGIDDNILQMVNTEVKVNLSEAINLANEFANITVTEEMVKRHIHSEKDMQPFIEEIFRSSKENNLFQEYVNRSKIEAGVDDKQVIILMEENVTDRVNKLFDKVFNIYRMVE